LLRLEDFSCTLISSVRFQPPEDLRIERTLVTASGSVVGQGIIKCLKLANANTAQFHYGIVATDASPLAAGLYRGEAGVIVPRADDPDYIDSMVAACKKHDAAAIFPGSDEELLPLAKARRRIEKESGAKVIVNSTEVIETCSDKWSSYIFLMERGVPVPRSAVPETAEAFCAVAGFPVVVKPRGGHGSMGLEVARSMDEVEHAEARIREEGWEPMLQEYVGDDSHEYTTGITMGGDGKRVLSSISMRRTLKGGQTYKAFIDDYADVRKAAEGVALRLGARGPINVQSRTVDEVQKVFDVNPRFSASCPMRAVAGVNEPDLLFRDMVLGEEVMVKDYQRLVSMRYWDEVYVRTSTFEQAAKSGVFSGPDSAVLPYF
jgi:carbamoyl-phosphate synthase large subunit